MTTFQFEHLWSFLTGGAGGAIAAWLVQAAVGHQYALHLESHKAEVKRDVTQQLELARADLEEHGRLHREQWQIKRDACLAALRIVDRVLTNFQWPDPSQPGKFAGVKTLPVETEEARDTMNRLILSCNNPDVALLFLKAAGFRDSGETVVEIGDVQDLRNAIRKELGFGKEFIFPPTLSWLISIQGDQANRGESADERDPT